MCRFSVCLVCYSASSVCSPYSLAGLQVDMEFCHCADPDDRFDFDSLRELQISVGALDLLLMELENEEKN